MKVLPRLKTVIASQIMMNSSVSVFCHLAHSKAIECAIICHISNPVLQMMYTQKQTYKHTMLVLLCNV